MKQRSIGSESRRAILTVKIFRTFSRIRHRSPSLYRSFIQIKLFFCNLRPNSQAPLNPRRNSSFIECLQPQNLRIYREEKKPLTCMHRVSSGMGIGDSIGSGMFLMDMIFVVCTNCSWCNDQFQCIIWSWRSITTTGIGTQQQNEFN